MTTAKQLKEEREAALHRAVDRLAAAHEKQAQAMAEIAVHLNNLVAVLATLSKKSVFESIFGK